jgi:hypothetical protein
MYSCDWQWLVQVLWNGILHCFSLWLNSEALLIHNFNLILNPFCFTMHVTHSSAVLVDVRWINSKPEKVRNIAMFQNPLQYLKDTNFCLTEKTVSLWVGFKVIKTAVLKSCIFWNMTPCNPLRVSRRFRETCRLLLQGQRINHARNQCEAGSKQSHLCLEWNMWINR